MNYKVRGFTRSPLIGSFFCCVLYLTSDLLARVVRQLRYLALLGMVMHLCFMYLDLSEHKHFPSLAWGLDCINMRFLCFGFFAAC